jgi:hypothetical protein
MPPQTPHMFMGRRVTGNQKVRLLTAYEKSRLCDWPDCSKPATGADEQEVYCSAHFFAAVSKRWRR